MSGARGSRRHFPESPRRDRQRGRSEPVVDEPIVEELFSVERLEEHARTLAAAQVVAPASSRGVPIRPRVVENAHVLLESYRVLARAIEEERAITPAAEWLVDNFTIVDEQVREIRDDLPADYYRELPKVAEGHLAGYPRVLGLMWAYVAHTDSRFDPETLRRMVRAYQQVEPLTIGELWAIAISLRILLVENLRRLAERIVRGRADRQFADELADTLLGLGTEGPADASMSVRRLERAQLTTSAQVQLFQRLRDQDPTVTPALPWLERFVESQGVTTEELVQRQHQRMATMNVTVRNVITSMRLISWFDWAEFVESVSVVDEVLRDGARSPRWTSPPRPLSEGRGRAGPGVGRTEVDVAHAAIALTASVQSDDDGDTSMLSGCQDPGYYLVADGRSVLEHSLHVRVSRLKRLRRTTHKRAQVFYLGSLTLLTGLIVAVPLVFAGHGHGCDHGRGFSPSARRPGWRRRSSTGPSPPCSVLGRCRDSISMTASPKT